MADLRNDEQVDAELVKMSLLAAQVCVPWTWTDEQARDFLESKAPCGTENGWAMRKQGHERLAGCDERVQCTRHTHRCHIMFEA